MLKLRTDCSLFALKSAHSSRLLPPGATQAGADDRKQVENNMDRFYGRQEQIGEQKKIEGKDEAWESFYGKPQEPGPDAGQGKGQGPGMEH